MNRNDRVQTCKFLAFCMFYNKQEKMCDDIQANHLNTGLQCYMPSIHYNVVYILVLKCYSIQSSCFLGFIFGKVGEEREGGANQKTSKKSVKTAQKIVL